MISRSSFQSLIDSYLDKKSNLYLQARTSSFTVEDLDGLIEGYQNTFEEEANVAIVSQIVSYSDLTIDETFKNVAMKMTQLHQF